MLDVPDVIVLLMVASWAAFVACPAVAFYGVWRWGRPPRSAPRAYLAATLGFVAGLGVAVVGLTLAINIAFADAMRRDVPSNLD